MADILGSLDEFTTLSPSQRIKKLKPELIISIIVAFAASGLSIYLWSLQGQKPDFEKEFHDLQQRYLKLEEENASLRTRLQALEEKGTRQSLDLKKIKTDSANLLNFQYVAFQASSEEKSKAEKSSGENPPAEPTPVKTIVIFIALAAVSIVYVGSLFVVFCSTSAPAVTLATDLLKTLTGFFCGLVMGLLGLSS